LILNWAIGRFFAAWQVPPASKSRHREYCVRTAKLNDAGHNRIVNGG